MNKTYCEKRDNVVNTINVLAFDKNISTSQSKILFDMVKIINKNFL